jgi:hypothetical protein
MTERENPIRDEQPVELAEAQLDKAAGGVRGNLDDLEVERLKRR